ncbi:MAG: tRNA 2-thiouridine(34) synthase MnmA [Eggerthellaceae bacterium]|nr:tRNA 2-thiouridine(34) synthase MnmA [Eggerthellaceae bacterium]
MEKTPEPFIANSTDVSASTTARPRVLSAMSGGVDSSVATLLLMRQGFDVAGITMKLFDAEVIGPDAQSTCCSLDDVEDAKAVCRRLEVPHYTLNFKERFAECVVDPFCESYAHGETPNPCIECNRHLKFAGLQQRRRELGADYVATGHYVQRAFDDETGTWQLLRAADRDKDQSYVLYHLTQDDLAHMLFPLGGLHKGEVRELAAENGFVNAEKPESQDICFVPDGNYAAFIERRRGTDGSRAANDPFAPGDIVDETGRVRGRHNGLIHYTIGQRKGIGVANPVPLYVVAKNVAENQLMVAPHEGLMTSEVPLRDVNIISGDYTPRTVEVAVKLSYRQEPVPAEFEILPHRRAVIRLASPQVRPAPGQAAVAYVGETVLGGGTVDNLLE